MNAAGQQPVAGQYRRSAVPSTIFLLACGALAAVVLKYSIHQVPEVRISVLVNQQLADCPDRAVESRLPRCQACFATRLLLKICKSQISLSRCCYCFERCSARQGHVGVYWRGGRLLQSITDPGLHFRVPFLDTYAAIQVTLQTDKVTDIPCGTKGGVTITFAKVEVGTFKSSCLCMLKVLMHQHAPIIHMYT